MTMKRHKHHHDWGGKKDDRMAYEKGTPMNFAMSGSAFAEGWERIFGGGKAKQPTEVREGSEELDAAHSDVGDYGGLAYLRQARLARERGDEEEAREWEQAFDRREEPKP